MTEENKGRPETPTIDAELGIETPVSPAVESVAQRLGGAEEVATVATDAPVAKETKMVDLNNLSTDQVQDLQELFSSTPRRKAVKDSFHTVELREVNGKVIIEWGQSYFQLQRDSVMQKDVMKTMIPVHFEGDVDAEGKKVFTNLLYKEEFMSANKVTCKILQMDKKDDAVIVGSTMRRGSDGQETSQEVEMYVNKVIITLTVSLPNGHEAVMDGKFAN